MATLTLLAAGTYAPQTFAFPAQSIVQGLTLAQLLMTRSNWTDTGGDVVDILSEISTNGGASWRLLMQFRSRGGPPNTPSFVETALPPQVGATLRQVRGSLTLLTTLTTGAQLIVT